MSARPTFAFAAFAVRAENRSSQTAKNARIAKKGTRVKRSFHLSGERIRTLKRLFLFVFSAFSVVQLLRLGSTHLIQRGEPFRGPGVSRARTPPAALPDRGSTRHYP